MQGSDLTPPPWKLAGFVRFGDIHEVQKEQGWVQAASSNQFANAVGLLQACVVVACLRAEIAPEKLWPPQAMLLNLYLLRLHCKELAAACYDGDAPPDDLTDQAHAIRSPVAVSILSSLSARLRYCGLERAQVPVESDLSTNDEWKGEEDWSML